MALKRLSPKMLKFCQNIASGMAYIDSYIDAYDFEGKRESASTLANRLLLREDIQKKVKELLKGTEEAIKLKNLADREERLKIINQRIERCIEKDDDVAIARYIEILNKMQGEYVTQFKQVDTRPPEIVRLDTEQLRKLASS